MLIENVQQRKEWLEEEINQERVKQGYKPLKPKQKKEQKTIRVSTTDPESGYYHRDHKERGFMYLDHRTVDGKCNIIVDCHITKGNVHDSQPYIERMEWIKETFDFLHSLDISYLHVFTYSERDNTHALTIDEVVPKNIRHERNKSLRNLSYMKMQYFTQQHAGQTRKVLFEGKDKSGMIEGYTDNYIKIATPAKEEWVSNA